jgi:hypothetical protein
MPIRAAAEAAAVGSHLTADEIERILRRLREQVSGRSSEVPVAA